MSELHTSLLNGNLTFESLYETVRQQLVDYQKSIDELQILGESEIDQGNINTAFQALKSIQIQSLTIKESLMKLEQLSRGVDQRNKTKKLRDLYTNQQQRQQQLYKNMVNDCSYESLKELLKGIDKMMKSSSKQEVQEFIIQPNTSSSNSTRTSYQPQQMQDVQQTRMMEMEPMEQFEHLDWHNQIIRQNQEEIDIIHQKTQTINKIVQDLALEVEHQDTYFEIIDKNVNTTKDNVVKTQETLIQTEKSQKSNKKKYICMLICASITFLTILLIILL